jgi:ATP-binding cassette subfamily C protein LapB
VGTLLACTLLSSRALSPITQIVALINRYQQAKTGFLAVDQIMNLPIENPANSTSIHRPNLNGRIEFANLSFQYPSASLHSLQNISFNILAGEKVGIIGRMGSGKSTIEKMIMKFYQPTQGRILIDDVDLQKLDPAELRQQIGYVPQDVVLFKGSIKDNIRIGAPNASEAAILNAAELSGVMSFVGTDPQGLEREVGEGGKFLSGGQRQAIAIARALLIDPPIVLMDEPSNGMDETNTHLLMQRMQSFFAEKTLVLVTHKAALLKWVNRIIVMDNGVLVADGPRDAILERLSEGQIHLGY